MYAKRSIIMLVSLLVIAMIASCNVLPGQNTVNKKLTNWKTGTQGLVMNFLENNPPPRVYTGDSLILTVEYVNKGAYDIQGGYFYLSGFDPSIINLDRSSTNFAAVGKSLYNPEGNLYQTLSFTDTRIMLPREFGADSFTQDFLLTACYDYHTQASPSVCIDPDPYTADPVQKVCTAHDVTLSGGQGGQVEVTSIEDQSSRDRIMYKINIKNSGGGDVIDPTITVGNCHIDLKEIEMNKVAINAEISKRPMTCNPIIIRLDKSGRGFAFCSLPTHEFVERTSFNTILDVYLDYGYRESIRKSVEIVNR